jgi:uncharacterized protein (DUF1501 family)
MVFLFGGNDSFNLVVPRGAAEHAEYAAVRHALAVPRERLLPIQPRTGDGRSYGLHPAAPELAALFGAGRLAIVANVGPLEYPTTRADYLARRVPVPAQLFSHNDQQPFWQLAAPDTPERLGWGGRAADRLLDGDPDAPVAISLAGVNDFQGGARSTPFELGAQGPVALDAFAGPDNARRYRTYRALIDGGHAQVLERHFAAVQRRAIAFNERIAAALADAPPLATPFPGGALAAQLRLVARLIAVRQRLGVARQTFFVAHGGYDTHDRQLGDQPRLFAELSQALAAFHGATVELGVDRGVTAFTASDFGRSLTINGDGTDHGWGGHQLVVGGAVQGGEIYGAMPTLVAGGPDDCGDTGLLIPRIAVDQYAATLARWFGVADADLDAVFPRLARFDARRLPFLGA